MFSPSCVIGAPHGIVAADVEWGSSVQAYTYVFSGQVISQNHPCSNAQVDVSLDSDTAGVISQTTTTGEDGRYQMEITLRGKPEDSSMWKLEAHSSTPTEREAAEMEGRVIIMEGQSTVVVNQHLLLTQV